MQYTQLGRSGAKVSRLCLGTMNFGPQTAEPDSFAIMDKALNAGIQFFDTANVYGGKKGEGVTEQIVGRWFEKSGRRKDILLATKVYGNMGDGVNDRGLSAYHIRAACDASLQRLKTDHIDLYQMHHVDRATPWEEIFQAMDTLVAQGKIIYVGTSNVPAYHIATANQVAKHRGSMGVVCEQPKYSLTNRNIELEVLPCCRYYGVGVIPWSPLDGGMLGGVPRDIKEGRRAGMKDHVEKMRPKLEAWENLCRELGETPADVALAWTLHVPGVTAPIIGPRTMDQLTGALHAVEIKLSDETLKKLDELFPGPGGPNARSDSKGLLKNEAPEAYSW